ncbi:MAG TPA: histidine phosphatase family protein [Anaeromyxobacteraceae bacterium]|nr:histidine phosphatase family protein [Anaeromyxobacteraceae bacterium]
MGRSVPQTATRVHLVRHGETQAPRGTIAGRLDVPLALRGFEQARSLAALLSSSPLASVYASTSRRAVETARAIAAPHGLEPNEVADLREIDFGLLEGTTFAVVAREYPEIAHAWLHRPDQVRFPNGESFLEMHRRARRSLLAILGRHAATAVALVCHAGPIRALVAEALGFTQQRSFEIACAVGSVTTLDFASVCSAPLSARLVRYEDVPPR